MPSGFSSKIKSIDLDNKSIDEAFTPMSVTLTLEDEIDISRGDTIVKEEEQPEVTQDVQVMICWLNEKQLVPNGKYALKHTTKDVRCMVKEIQYKVNINTLEQIQDDKTVGLNDIAKLTLRLTAPIVVDKYKQNRITGSLILLDEATNVTVGAGMII